MNYPHSANGEKMNLKFCDECKESLSRLKIILEAGKIQRPKTPEDSIFNEATNRAIRLVSECLHDNKDPT